MTETAPATAEHFDECRDLLYERCGIRLPESRREVLGLRLAALARRSGLADPEVFVERIREAPDSTEWDEFVDALTVQETYFFRVEQHFEWVASTLVDRLAARDREQPGTIWSAGCSTGEEPYSIAIVLAERAGRLHGRSCRVVATDISGGAIRTAERATFGARSLRLVGAARRRRWFHERDDGRSELDASIVASVHFARHNLVDAAPVQGADCVFLRNVMIYFDRASRERVLANVRRAVAPGGYLVLGPTEGVADLLGGWPRVAPFVHQRPGAAA